MHSTAPCCSACRAIASFSRACCVTRRSSRAGTCRRPSSTSTSPTAASRAGDPTRGPGRSPRGSRSLRPPKRSHAAPSGATGRTDGRCRMPWRLRLAGSHGPGRAARQGLGRPLTCRRRSGWRRATKWLHRSVAPGSNARAVVDGASLDYRYAWDGATAVAAHAAGDHAFQCRRRAPARSAEAEGARASAVHATINGRVLQVCVTAGQRGRAGRSSRRARGDEDGARGARGPHWPHRRGRRAGRATRWFPARCCVRYEGDA